MSESPESQRLCDFAWLRATNGGEAQGYPPIVRRLLAAHDDVEARLAEATALLVELRAPLHKRSGAALKIDAFLSSAPAQPAAPEHPFITAQNGGTAAPEPSAIDRVNRRLSEVDRIGVELAHVKAQRDDNENAWACEKQKRESAEAQLAAVTQERDDANQRAEYWLQQEMKRGVRLKEAKAQLAAVNSIITETEGAIMGERMDGVRRRQLRAYRSILDVLRPKLSPPSPGAAKETTVCGECGACHGPGNTNTLCPLASNYRGAVPGEKP